MEFVLSWKWTCSFSCHFVVLWITASVLFAFASRCDSHIIQVLILPANFVTWHVLSLARSVRWQRNYAVRQERLLEGAVESCSCSFLEQNLSYLDPKLEQCIHSPRDCLFSCSTPPNNSREEARNEATSSSDYYD